MLRTDHVWPRNINDNAAPTDIDLEDPQDVHRIFDDAGITGVNIPAVNVIRPGILVETNHCQRLVEKVIPNPSLVDCLRDSKYSAWNLKVSCATVR